MRNPKDNLRLGVTCLLLATSATVTHGEGQNPAAAAVQKQAAPKPANPKAEYVGPVGQAVQPTVTLSPDNITVAINDKVTFTATPNPPATDGQYYFNFDDGTPEQFSTSNTIEHAYARAATYHPSVRVLTRDGEQSATSAPVAITVGEPQKISETGLGTETKTVPKVIVRRENNVPLVTGNVIEAQVTLDPPVKNAGFDVDWGDGTKPERIGAKGLAAHRYSEPGWHDVVATALTDEYGQPLRGTLRLDIAGRAPPPPPPPSWLRIGAWLLAAAAIIGLIAWVWPRPDSTLQTAQGDSNKPQQTTQQGGLRCVAHQGLARHAITKSRSRLVGAMTVRTGADEAEHSIRFAGE